MTTLHDATRRRVSAQRISRMFPCHALLLEVPVISPLRSAWSYLFPRPDEVVYVFKIVKLTVESCLVPSSYGFSSLRDASETRRPR